jgi:hypothetical protein
MKNLASRVTHSWRSHEWVAQCARAAAPIALLLFTAVILLRFPPAQYNSFYPQCPIHHFFGILCPGCGTTRALAALLHGNVSEALRLNALTMLMLPIVSAYAATKYSRVLAGKPLHWSKLHPSAIYAMSAMAIAFTIARNL